MEMGGWLLGVTDFNYNTDGYEGEGAEDGKSQDGSETLPYIDESPTMSPQLCAPQGPDGEAVSPTPPEGLPPGAEEGHQGSGCTASVVRGGADLEGGQTASTEVEHTLADDLF
ncbi:Active breakpoint cluster region-related protein [Takifugu flavidus]|uniref:Active breakpoint cluster region-related protein n=1 Tax=Takifugu flavidus TaxID=433684 RepID=A0A5C6P653_9TELE|nr:Active breakpoint cluster region-related protein [Takifugu flavidus]